MERRHTVVVWAAAWLTVSCSALSGLDDFVAVDGAGGAQRGGAGAQAGAGPSGGMTGSGGDVSGQGGAGMGGAAGGGATGGGGGSDCLYVQEVLADQPIAYWRLGEASGPAVDLIGGVEGTHTDTTRAVASLVDCGGDGATRFDSPAAVIAMGDLFDFDGLVAYSVEAWVEWDEVNGQIVRKSNGTTNGWNLSLTGAGGNTLVGFRRFIGGSNQDDHNPIAPRSIRHVVGTYDGSSEICVFVDGVNNGCDSATGAMADTGAALQFGGTDFEGVIDEVAFYDKALSPTRIQAHHDAGRN